MILKTAARETKLHATLKELLNLMFYRFFGGKGSIVWRLKL